MWPEWEESKCTHMILVDKVKKILLGQPRYRFLVNDQRDAQFFTTYLFLFLTLYMFRAHRAHHQERQIVST